MGITGFGNVGSSIGKIAGSQIGAISPTAAASGGTSGGSNVFGMQNNIQLAPVDTSGITDTTGQNAIFNSLQNAVQNLQPVNAQSQAAKLGAVPQFSAPTASAASGTAAQGSAATGTAAQMAPSSFNAAQSIAAGYNPSLGNASSMNAALGSASSMNAALGGNASNIGGASGTAALAGSPALAGYANLIRAAQGGYMTGGPVNVSTAGDAAFMAQQQRLADILGTQAAGGGVSPADLQLAQGRDSNMAAQLAILGSQRGNMGNAALTARAAADQGAASTAQLNQQMGIQRAQETLAAQNALGSVLGTARGQSQAYNADQAALNQQTSLANLANAQGATMQNAGFNQQGALANLNNVQQSILANAAAQNQNQMFNASQNQNMNLANMNAALQSQEFNAGANNSLLSQNLNALNSANSTNAQLGQTMTLADMANSQNAAALNAQQAQAMTLSNMNAQNQAGQFNAGNLQQTSLANQNSTNAALSQSSAQAQAASLANMQGQNAMTGLNLQNLNAMDLANLSATNAFGMQNMQNSQQVNLANAQLAAAQNALNQQTQSQFDLQQGAFNQQTSLANAQNALTSQNQFIQQYLASLGLAQNVAQSENTNAGIAAQIQSAQSIAQGQVNAGISAANAQANANLLGAAIGAGGAVIGAGLPLLGKLFSSGGGGADVGGAVPGTVGIDPGGADVTGIGGAVNLDSTPFTLSDENLKEGITGGNPMLQSFLSSYRSAMQPTLSDDRQKENVISGNQGMQAFLKQANAQQQAQSTQGSTNNAFMQTGQAPSAQVDRQLPPSIQGGQLPQYLSGNPNAGYGMNPGIQGQTFNGANTLGQVGAVQGTNAGQGTAGGFQGGSVTPTSIASQGGFQAGGMTQAAGFQNGGMPTASSVLGGGLSSTGSMTPGGVIQNAGITSTGGVTSQPTMAGGGFTPGGQTQGVPTEGAGSVSTFAPHLGSQTFTVAKPIPQLQQQAGIAANNIVGTVRPNVPVTSGPVGNVPVATTAPVSPNFHIAANPPPVQPAATAPVSSLDNLGPLSTNSTPFAPPVDNMPPPAGSPFAPTTNTLPPAITASAPAASPALSSTNLASLLAPAPAAPADTGPNAVNNLTPADIAQMMANNPSAFSVPAASPPLTFSMLSDEREKTDVQPSDSDLETMLDRLHAYSYRYKDPSMPGASPGQKMGVMAQDLEKSPLGASFVRDTPQGKMVDYGQAAGTMMAGLAYHNERLDEHDRLLRQIAGQNLG